VFPVYERIRGFNVASGRGLSEQDEVEHARVVARKNENKKEIKKERRKNRTR